MNSGLSPEASSGPQAGPSPVHASTVPPDLRGGHSRALLQLELLRITDRKVLQLYS